MMWCNSRLLGLTALLGLLPNQPSLAQTTAQAARSHPTRLAQAAQTPSAPASPAPASPAPASQAPNAQATGVCPAQLAGAVAPIIDRLTSARWGILIQTLGNSTSRKTLFERNAKTLLTPASNNKILTTAAALSKLGADYRIRTTVLGSSRQPVLTTLRIVGHGDPSLTTASLAALAQQVSQQGIRQVTQLIGDDTYFRGPAVNPTWDRDDTLAGYGAAVNSLMLNQNGIALTLFPQQVGQPLRVDWADPSDTPDWRVQNRSKTVAAGEDEYLDAVRDPVKPIIMLEGQLRVGAEPEPIAVSVPNPGNYLLQKFRTALANAQVTVTRSTLVSSTPPPKGEVELAALESPPLAELLKETNQESNNIYAEALLKTIGKLQTPTTLDATASGIAAIKAILGPLGVNASGYSTVDGSGLSPRDRVSPEALVQTLQAMAQSRSADVFRASLPVAGVSGTLKNRFRNTAAVGIVQAKTGTIAGAVTLSGYMAPVNHPPIVFSILVNQPNASSTSMRQAVDEIVLVLAQLKSCR